MSSELSSNVSKIYSTNTAFAALKSDATVVTWGNQNNGGNSSSVDDELWLVTEIYSSDSAFAALKYDGSVWEWGSYPYGGDSSSVSSSLTSGVSTIIPSAGGFVALKSDGSVVGWGNAYLHSSVPAYSDTRSDVVNIFSNGAAFAALKSNGSVVTWGSPTGGGNSSSVSSELSSGVTHVYGTPYWAFAALKDDGTVVTWGATPYGGSTSYAGGIGSGELINVTNIYPNARAFAALMANGTVLTWGETNCNIGAPCGTDLTGVIEIYSTNTAFAAIIELAN